MDSRRVWLAEKRALELIIEAHDEKGRVNTADVHNSLFHLHEILKAAEETHKFNEIAASVDALFSDKFKSIASVDEYEAEQTYTKALMGG